MQGFQCIKAVYKTGLHINNTISVSVVSFYFKALDAVSSSGKNGVQVTD